MTMFKTSREERDDEAHEQEIAENRRDPWCGRCRQVKSAPIHRSDCRFFFSAEMNGYEK